MENSLGQPLLPWHGATTTAHFVWKFLGWYFRHDKITQVGWVWSPGLLDGSRRTRIRTLSPKLILREVFKADLMGWSMNLWVRTVARPTGSDNRAHCHEWDMAKYKGRKTPSVDLWIPKYKPSDHTSPTSIKPRLLSQNQYLLGVEQIRVFSSSGRWD